MTDADDALSRLFREPSAPERDEAFAAPVLAEIMRLRRRSALLLALRLAVAIGLLAVVAIVSQTFVPRLPDLSGFLGGLTILTVPAPLVIAGLLFGLAVHTFGELQRRGIIPTFAA